MSSMRKVVVITGASQGIGAGLVRGFLDRGWRVVANSRSIEPVASEDMLAVPGDIADPAVADRAVETFGRVDTLVNNAGIFIAKPFIEYTEADFAAKIAVNLAGFFYVTQRAVRQMLVQGGGHVVNLTTTLVGQPVKGVPSALASLTKGGLGRRRPTRESVPAPGRGRGQIHGLAGWRAPLRLASRPGDPFDGGQSAQERGPGIVRVPAAA